MKESIVSFFLSKIDINKFSDFIKRSVVLSIPYKIIVQRLIDWNFPYHVFLESTNICNLHCKICTRNIAPIKLGSMDFELFKKIVNEASVYGSRNFSLHLFGEPLLAPNIIPMIKYIKQKNNKNTVLITTNGVLLNNKISQEIIMNGVDKIIVSIHGANKEQYENMTGTDNLNNVEENIKNLINLKNKKNKPKIFLRMVSFKKNTTEIKKFYKRWSSYPVIIDIKEPHNFGGQIETGRSIDSLPKRYPCYHLWLAPGINWDGQVSICCCDTFKDAIIGNVNQNSLHKIWNGEKLKQYRDYHLRGKYDKIPVCKNCDVWTTYPDIFFEYQKK
ncbi:MAG: radical SAM protein [Patescibacteria group bacterium]